MNVIKNCISCPTNKPTKLKIRKNAKNLIRNGEFIFAVGIVHLYLGGLKPSVASKVNILICLKYKKNNFFDIQSVILIIILF